MEHSTEIVEVFYKAFKSLKKEERKQLAIRIIVDTEISDDWLDHILIEKAKKEPGQDVALDEFVKNQQ
jgi:hypothetical protein